MKVSNLFIKIMPLLLGLISLTACQDDLVPDLEPGTGRLKISNDAASLSKRVSYKNDTIDVLPISDVSSARSQVASYTSKNKETYRLIAEIESPIINGLKSSATHIHVDKDRAYITYHIAGSPYGGGFDVVDLDHSDHITLSNSAQFSDTDFNALAIKEHKGKTNVYLAGANGKGAYVQSILIDKDQIIDETDSVQLLGFNANGIAASKDQLYVTVGGSSQSGYYALNIKDEHKKWNTNEFIEADYAKDVALESKSSKSPLVFLNTGKSASISVGKASSKGIGSLNQIAARETQVKDGKNSIAIDGAYIYAAMGDQGFSVYDKNKKELISQIQTSEMGGGLTNGVSAAGKNIFIANGAGGVFIAEKNKDDFKLTGVLNMAGSANYVMAYQDYLLVANGIGGVKVLYKEKSEGNINACLDGDQWNVNTSGSFKIHKDEIYVKSGSINFRNDVTIDGALYNCGTLQVGTNLNIQKGGKIDSYGSVVVNRDLTLNQEATLVIEGSLVIVGNFNFGGKIIFKGAGSSLLVYGNVNNNGGSYEGNYNGTPLS